jgi:hypothetical protein
VIGIGETKKRNGVAPDQQLMAHCFENNDHHGDERIGCSVLESETGSLEVCP